MQSPIRKRSIVIAGHKTSISLEDAFWNELKQISKHRRSTLSDTVTEVERTKTEGNLSSALRLFVLKFYQAASHAAAQHLSDPDRHSDRAGREADDGIK